MRSKVSIFGQVHDASVAVPPKDAEVLLFHDEVFAWALGIYDHRAKKYVSKWTTPVLYWVAVPPRSLLFLKSSSSVLKPKK